jgi:5-methyltetrahydrofolate--homocysteine methyltransferase
VIGEIHRAYAEAGADIIETNTFGGSPMKLAEYGLAERCVEINREAAKIAREAVAGRDVYVAGNIGPLGKLVEPMGDAGVDQAFDAFALQAKSLAEGGADLIVIETMTTFRRRAWHVWRPGR